MRSTNIVAGIVLLCLALAGPTSVFGAERIIGAASSTVDFFPNAAPDPAELSEEISLSSARGESESAQIVIAAGNGPVDIGRVVVSDLRSGSAKISRASVEVRLVGYVDLKGNSWRGVKRTGLWPDPLLRFRPFTCPAGETRSLWITVKTPRNARASEYTGRVSLLSADGEIAVVPMRLRVRGFALPKKPSLHTSYWNDFGARYDVAKERKTLGSFLRMFGDYRTSTNLWFGNDVKWYLERNGKVACDSSGMMKNIALASDAGFSALQVGTGCWATSAFSNPPIISRRTGKALGDAERAKLLETIARTLSDDQKSGFPETFFARLYLNKMCDWLESKGLLDRAYMQLYDESPDREVWKNTIAPLYERYRGIEPRLKLLGLTVVHPVTQGLYDIWSPHLAFYDATAYDVVRRGISLAGPKNFKATVTASSCGRWGVFIIYQPEDAYDDCDYTKWAPASSPSVDNPEWLRFDLDQPASIDGIRIVPYGNPEADTAWTLEASLDGQSFQPLKLDKRPGVDNAYSFPPGHYKAIRLVYTKLDSKFVPSDIQPMPPPESLGAGVREVEFLRQGLPPEASLPRAEARPSVMWEYNVGADYPSVCVDANPAEIRATGWQCWQRGVVGYLNYGAAQWALEAPNVLRPKGEDPLIWRQGDSLAGEATDGFGSASITYPGRDEVLPSIRFARFRDGVDDNDYLVMLQERQPNHPALKRLLEAGRGSYSTVASMLEARESVAEALEQK